MTMLTHTHGPFERAPYSAGRQGPAEAGSAPAYLAMIKQLFTSVLMMLAAGAAVAAIMALKISIYLPRFIHH